MKLLEKGCNIGGEYVVSLKFTYRFECFSELDWGEVKRIHLLYVEFCSAVSEDSTFGQTPSVGIRLLL